MPKYIFIVEVEYDGDEPYTDEIQDGLKDKFPQCNFRVERAAQQGVHLTASLHETQTASIVLREPRRGNRNRRQRGGR